MAASAPHAVSNWNEASHYSSDDQKALEIGMSGLSLVSRVPGSGSRPPALSGSSVSSAPDDHHHHNRHHSFGSFSFPNSDSHQFQNNSLPPSPSSQAAVGSFSHKFLPKPPGLSEPSLGSFSHRGFDQNWGAITDADSFDRSEDPDDGLLGLGAIRERAHSSPGPMYPISSSPPVRIDVNAFQTGDLSPLYTDGDRVRGLPPDPRRNRSHISKSSTSGGARPPLSGQSNQLAFLDSSFGSGANYGGRGSPGSTDYSSEYSHMPGGRSDMAERLQGRSRSLTAGSEPQMQDLNRSAHNEQFRPHNIDHTQKFGNLPSLSNIQSQRLPHQQVLPPSRHIRSYSHSGTLQHVNGQEAPDDRRFVDQQGRVHHQRLHSDGADQFYGADDIYARGVQGNSMLPRSPSYNDHHSAHSALTTGLMQRSVSMSQAIPHHGFEGQMLQRRNTEFLGEAQYAAQTSRLHNFPSFHSRDEFVGSDSNGMLRQSHDEMRSFGSQGYDDRSRNHHVTYQVPVRRHNDYTYSTTSSEPLQSDSIRSGGRYVVDGTHDLRAMPNSGFDDDLTHPLAGEDIDDPGDDLGFGNPSSMIPAGHHMPHVTYMRNDGSSSSRSQTSMFSHHAPTDSMTRGAAGSSVASPRLVYTIKFKRTQRNFIPGPRVSGDLKIGCYVKVEADRGEDLGIVVNKIPAEKFNVAGRSTFRGAGSPGGVSDMGVLLAPSMTNLADLKRVVRLATHDEVGLLAAKREEEEELLKVCREKVQQRSLPMHVVDAEYQFDRHKLTFFFEAECRIDFRELVRDLFSMYKTRIWMQQLDKNNSGTASPAALSPLVDYGSMNQVPVMADSINDPYGIPQSDHGGSGGVH